MFVGRRPQRSASDRPASCGPRLGSPGGVVVGGSDPGISGFVDIGCGRLQCVAFGIAAGECWNFGRVTAIRVGMEYGVESDVERHSNRCRHDGLLRIVVHNLGLRLSPRQYKRGF